VAEDVLRMVRLKGVRCLMDVGGGSGAFLAAVARAHPGLSLRLYDLPEVMAGAARRLGGLGLAGRVETVPGSFRDGALPEGADAISLVRVLYDHADDTVADLLTKCHAALPPEGRLIVAEPMSGGARPERAGDVYFSFYTMAMGTGRVRSAARIAEMCRAAGFAQVTMPRAPRPWITSALTCVRPG